MPYDTLSIRTPLIRACNKALQKRLTELAPNAYFTEVAADASKSRVVRQVPVNFGGDEQQYTEYSTPSLVLFNPTMTQLREIITHEDVFKDLDYDNLTAKQFPEPIPVKIRYILHAATRNPDNDASLLEFFIRLQREMSYIDIELLSETAQFDRVEIIWYDPTEIESNDISKIREIQFEVIAWLEVLNYKEVKLLAPGAAFEFTVEDYTTSKYYLKTKCALDVAKGATEISVVGNLKGWPTMGSCTFGIDKFTYTFRTTRKFLGVVGVTRYHSFDTVIEFCAIETSPPSPPVVVVPKPYPATWLEQTGGVIHGEVEGLAIGDFEWQKPNGDIEVTPIVDWVVVTEGTGKLVVKDEADLVNLQRVRLNILGPTPFPTVAAPDVEGLTEAAAEAALIAVTLVKGVGSTAYSVTVAKGLVISQNPVAGTIVDEGSAVALTVSLGVQYFEVPVTKGSTPAAGTAAIEAVGLVVGSTTYEMTDDTEVNLIGSSSPAAGTGLELGEAVDLVVSLGDRHTRIPVELMPTTQTDFQLHPAAIFDWLLPNGTTQSGVVTPAYLLPKGSPRSWAYAIMKAGYTVADLTRFVYGSGINCRIRTVDLKYVRPTDTFWQLQGCEGNIAEVNDMVGSVVAGLYFNDAAPLLYGSIDDWVPIKSGTFYLYSFLRVVGSVKFQTNAPTVHVRFNSCKGITPAQYSQTLVNWDACNAGVFDRTWNSDQIKRSELTAAGENALVSLIGKGLATYVFKPE